jgi:predicted RNase H-like nuclease
MCAAESRELPYKLVAGATPCRDGWLVVSARLKGATFAPDFPRITGELLDIITRRPAFSIVNLNAPMGAIDLALRGERTPDVEARELTGYSVSTLRWRDQRPPWGDDADEPENPNNYLRGRYGEIVENMAPYLQRTICEGLPELSFYQLNGERPLEHAPFTEEGYHERRLLVGKVPGVTRILDFVLDGVDRFQLLDVAALLWSSRRITSRAGKRVPSIPVWDEEGLRIEIFR